MEHVWQNYGMFQYDYFCGSISAMNFLSHTGARAKLGPPPAKGPRDGLLFPVDSYFVSGTPRFRIVYQSFQYVLFPLVNQQRSSPIEDSKE